MLRTRGNSLTWLGHAAFRITTPTGKVVLIDPWIASNPACPPELKKPGRVDTMLITHGHFDHIADAVELGKKFKPQIVGIYEIGQWLESKGVGNVQAMNKGGTQRVGEIEVTMVNAIHSCGILDDGKIVYGGEACGYVIRLPGGLTIYCLLYTSSAVGMDKDVQKRLFRDAGLPIVPFHAFSRTQWEAEREDVLALLRKKFKFPVFVKPANLGSSVGMSRVAKASELGAAIDTAAEYAQKILIERGVKARCV